MILTNPMKPFQRKILLYHGQLQMSDFEIQQEKVKTSFTDRLCGKREHSFWKRVCSDCKKDFEHNKLGKSIIYKDFCGSPYCGDHECLKSRIGLAKLILKSYFYVFPKWRERGQGWLHLIFGKKRIAKITHATLSSFRKDLMNVLNFLRKEYQNPHMIAVLDIAYNGETFFLHGHVAMRIRGYLDEEKINEISFKNNLKYKRADGNYSRKPKALINYFAQRLAGKFEHDKNGSSWLYADLFSPEEYFDLFYRKKRFLTRGFDSKQVKDIRKRIKEGLLRFEETLSPRDTNNGIRKSCQYCGSINFERVFVEDPNKIIKHPPDPNIKSEILYSSSSGVCKIEVIKFT